MIKINLLPFRAARRKENVRRQVSVFFLLVIFSIVVLVYYTGHLKSKIEKIEHQNDAIAKEITQYKKKSDRVDQIKGQLAILEKKVDIINDLKKQRKKPLKILDSMTQLVVAERMWLRSLNINSTTVSITGIAFDNKTVADFMENLGNSPLFGDIDLKNLKMTSVNNLQMKSFELTCKRTDTGGKKEGNPKKK